MRKINNKFSKSFKFTICACLIASILLIIVISTKLFKTESLDDKKFGGKSIDSNSIELLSYSEIKGDDKQGYTLPDGRYYSHKLQLKGTMPNASQGDCITILTNNSQLTYEEVVKSIYSSNSNDHIDYYLVNIEEIDD